jgi:hypothetical protein
VRLLYSKFTKGILNFKDCLSDQDSHYDSRSGFPNYKWQRHPQMADEVELDSLVETWEQSAVFET